MPSDTLWWHGKSDYKPPISRPLGVSYSAKDPGKRFAPNTNRVSVGNQKLSFFEIASKDHIYPKIPSSAKLHLVVAFYASTLTKKALDI
jgi:hypothetical protein